MLVEQPDDARVELAQVAGVELRERDARHQVAAEHRLGIQARHRRELLAGLQLDQRADHAWSCRCRSRARTSSRVVSPRSTARMRPGERGDGDAARVVAERLRQRLQHRRGHVALARARRRRAAARDPTSGGAPRAAARRGRSCLVTPASILKPGARRASVPAPRIWNARSSSGGAASTVTGSVDGALAGEAIAVAHEVVAELHAIARGSAGGTVPATNFTRHDVQRPRPPQTASTSMPCAWAARRIVVPGSTSRTRRAPGSRTTTVSATVMVASL